MDMISRRNVLDLGEPRILQMPGEHHMSDKTVAPQTHRREAHPYLKGDASLFGHDQHRTTPPNQLRKFPKQRNRHPTLPCKMLAQSVSCASM